MTLKQIEATKISIGRKTIVGIALIAVFAVGAFAVVVTNNIKGSDGVISACYKTENGQLRVVEPGTTCNPSEEGISWGGPPSVAGFSDAQGHIGNQKGFTVTKLGTGRFKLVFPYSKFSDFPAIGVSAWGLPGQAPIINIFYNVGTPDGYESEIGIFAADGVTRIDSGFQFVATQIVQ
jgi:hypothetical protein